MSTLKPLLVLFGSRVYLNGISGLGGNGRILLKFSFEPSQFQFHLRRINAALKDNLSQTNCSVVGVERKGAWLEIGLY